MNIFGSRYVIDTNALIQMGRERRESNFFSLHAVIPSEVLHEAEGFPDYAQLLNFDFVTTPRVLEYLTVVMKTVHADDTRLVDLYKNLGGADPLVVACALTGKETDSQYLDAPQWVIVTGDEAVSAKAREFNLDVVDVATFAALIDEAQATTTTTCDRD